MDAADIVSLIIMLGGAILCAVFAGLYTRDITEFKAV